jgi:hypothetical protein
MTSPQKSILKTTVSLVLIAGTMTAIILYFIEMLAH